MSAALVAKAVRDRRTSTAVAVGTLVAFLLLGLAVYREMDLSVYTRMPEAFRALVGIPEGADATTLAFAAMYGSYGALTLAGIAISIGAGSIAGEERDGTLGLLLANPRSRRQVLWSKAAALGLLVAAAGVALLVGGYAGPALLGVELGDARVGALVVHVLAVTLFHGALALAVGAWTGRRQLASGVGAAVLTVGFVGAGVLPLVPNRLADLVEVLPWHWYAANTPFVHGVHLRDVAMLLVGTAALLAAARVGLDRRDLRDRDGGRTLLDRLRAHPVTRRVTERLAGRARVSSIWVHTTSEHQGLLVVTAGLMFWMMGVMMGPLFAAMQDALAGFEGLPEVILAIAGGGDMTTPEGFYRLETFGLMAPAAVMVVTVTVAARGLGGEEHDGTMGLLLANPITRRRVVLEKALAMLVLAVVVGAATFAGVVAGSVLGGLGMDVGGIAAASLLATLLGLAFGAIALAIGAATGRSRAASYGTVGLALLAYLASNLLPLAESLAGLARWSPWHHYLAGDPLLRGLAWDDAALLAGIAVAGVTAAVVLFDRRDLRLG